MDVECIVDRSFLSALENMCHCLLAFVLSDENSAVFELVFPYKLCVVPLWLLSRFFSLSLAFIMMCLSMDFFGFIQSWIL